MSKMRMSSKARRTPASCKIARHAARTPRPEGPSNRKGDVFFIQDFFAIAILVFIGILIFGLFYLGSIHFGSKVGSSGAIQESVVSTRGGETLRVYLATRMDEPQAKFLPAGVQLSSQIPADNRTFGEAIIAIAQDDACAKALADNGKDYPASDGKSASSYAAALGDAATQQIPDGLCRAFYLRTLLFFRTLAPSDDYLLRVAAQDRSFEIGKPKPTSGWTAFMAPLPSAIPSVPIAVPWQITKGIARGEQPLFGDPEITVQLYLNGGTA